MSRIGSGVPLGEYAPADAKEDLGEPAQALVRQLPFLRGRVVEEAVKDLVARPGRSMSSHPAIVARSVAPVQARKYSSAA